MKVIVKLPEGKTIWALNNPYTNGFIKETNEVGYQEYSLIITADSPPRSIDLDTLPEWAKNMIISSINAGELINSGTDTLIIEEKKKSEPKAEVEIATEEKPKKKTKKRKSKKKAE